MRCLPVLFVVAAISGDTLANTTDVPDKIAHYARESEQERFSTIASLEAKDKGQIKKKPTELYLKLTNPLEPYYAYMDPWDAGAAIDMGVVKWGNAKVFQVIDQKTALIELTKYIPQTRRGRTSSGQSYTVSARPREVNRLLWVTGIDTTNFIDRQKFDLYGIFEVAGNHTYETADGSNTIKKLRKLDISKYRDLFTLKHHSREWKANSGTHSVKAIYVKYQRGVVHLITTEGKTHKIRLSDLSQNDKEFVRDKIKPRTPKAG